MYNFIDVFELVLDFLDNACNDALDRVDGNAVIIVVMVPAGDFLLRNFDDNASARNVDFALDECFGGVLGSADFGEVFNATVQALYLCFFFVDDFDFAMMWRYL